MAADYDTRMRTDDERRARLPLLTPPLGERPADGGLSVAEHDELRTLHRPSGAYCVVCDRGPRYGDGVNNPHCTHKPRHCATCRAAAWPCRTAKILGLAEWPTVSPS